MNETYSESKYNGENIVNTSCGILTNLYLIQYEE